MATVFTVAPSNRSNTELPKQKEEFPIPSKWVHSAFLVPPQPVSERGRESERASKRARLVLPRSFLSTQEKQPDNNRLKECGGETESLTEELHLWDPLPSQKSKLRFETQVFLHQNASLNFYGFKPGQEKLLCYHDNRKKKNKQVHLDI